MIDGVFQAPKRAVRRVFLHCSASDADVRGQALVDLIDGWHRDRNFAEVGYHYIIDKEGAILAGRSLEKTPAAQKGHNLATIAICAHGLDFPDKWHLSAQAGALVNLCGQINAAYHGLLGFHGHCEVSNKACPVFDYKQLLQLDRWQRMP